MEIYVTTREIVTGLVLAAILVAYIAWYSYGKDILKRK